MPSRTPADPGALRHHLTGLFGEGGFLPPVDVYSTEGPPTLHVRVEVAGLDPARTQIRLDGRTLAVEGERSPDHGGRYQHMEIAYGRFERQVGNVFRAGEQPRGLWVDEAAGRALVLTDAHLQEVTLP